MEILGDGPGSGDELPLDRDARGRKGQGQDIGGRRRPVAASLDLGTTELASGVPVGMPARPGTGPRPSGAEPRAAGAPGTGDPPAGGPRAPTPEARVDALELSLDDAGPDDAQAAEPATRERDYRAGLLGAVFDAPSLALAGLGICLAGLGGGAPMITLYAELGNGGADAAPKLIAKALGAVGVLSAVLALLSLRRIRGTTPRWVASVAGATILLAVILLCAAGYFWWTASTLPPVEEGQY